MNNIDFFNNFSDAVCVFSDDNNVVFQNTTFLAVFNNF